MFSPIGKRIHLNYIKQLKDFVFVLKYLKGLTLICTHFFSLRITLGNQVDGVRLVDPDLIASFKKRYPDGNCMAPKPTV